MPWLLGTVLLFCAGGGARGADRETAALAEDLGGDGREGVWGTCGGRGGVGEEVLLPRAEELLGVVGLQRDVVGEVAEEVGEDGERLGALMRAFI